MPYICDRCSLLCNDLGALNVHMRSHTNEKPFSCTDCSRRFTQKGNLKTHVLTVHSTTKQFICDKCSKQFSKRKTLDNHMIKCRILNDVRITVSTNLNVDRNVLDPTSLLSTCRFQTRPVVSVSRAGTDFPSPYNNNKSLLNQLIPVPVANIDNTDSDQNLITSTNNTIHDDLSNLASTESVSSSKQSKINNELVCTRCDTSFKNETKLAIHMAIHDGVTPKPFSCHLCEKRFTQKGSLNAHLRFVHRGEKPFLCPSCLKGFSNKCHLKLHIRTHTNEKPHSCKECGKTFTRVEHLRYHLKIHTKEDLYGCAQCLSSFETRILLQKHIKLNHSRPKKSSLGSAEASRSTQTVIESERRTELPSEQPNLSEKLNNTSANNLLSSSKEASVRDDRKDFSNNTTDDSVSKSATLPAVKTNPVVFSKSKSIYRCTECDKTFCSSHQLVTHSRVHSGERPFPCGECGRKFTQAGSLYLHVQSVHELERKYGCSECGKKFARRGQLKRHAFVHSSEKPFKCVICDKSFVERNRLSHHVSSAHNLDKDVLEEVLKRSTQIPVASPRADADCESRNKVSPFPQKNASSLLLNAAKVKSSKRDKKHGKCKKAIVESDPTADILYANKTEGARHASYANKEVDALYATKEFDALYANKEVDASYANKHVNISNEKRLISGCSPYRMVTRSQVQLQGRLSSEEFCESSNERIVRNDFDNLLRLKVINDDDDDDTNEEPGKNKQILSKNVGNLETSERQRKHKNNEYSHCQQNMTNQKCFSEERDRISSHFPGTACLDEIPRSDSKSFECESRKVLLEITQKQVKMHQCPECSKQFKQKGHLVRHLKAHSGLKPFCCSACDRKFLERSKLLAHEKIHKMKTTKEPEASRLSEEQLTCKICNKKFLKECYLLKHLRLHDKGIDSSCYQCDRCSKQYRQRSSLDVHMRRHTGERPFACDVCTKRFARRSYLNRHRESHVENRDQPHACLSCPQRYFRLSSLVLHLRKAHGGVGLDRLNEERKEAQAKCRLKALERDPRPWSCRECSKRFCHRSLLATHGRVHSRERPFACPMCQKSFTQKGSLKSHMRFIHNEEKPWACRHCDQSFSIKRLLEKHVKRDHQDTVVVEIDNTSQTVSNERSSTVDATTSNMVVTAFNTAATAFKTTAASNTAVTVSNTSATVSNLPNETQTTQVDSLTTNVQAKTSFFPLQQVPNFVSSLEEINAILLTPLRLSPPPTFISPTSSARSPLSPSELRLPPSFTEPTQIQSAISSNNCEHQELTSNQLTQMQLIDSIKATEFCSSVPGFKRTTTNYQSIDSTSDASLDFSRQSRNGVRPNPSVTTDLPYFDGTSSYANDGSYFALAPNSSALPLDHPYIQLLLSSTSSRPMYDLQFPTNIFQVPSQTHTTASSPNQSFAYNSFQSVQTQELHAPMPFQSHLFPPISSHCNHFII